MRLKYVKENVWESIERAYRLRLPRKHYLDAKQAFDTDDVFKRLAGVLRSKK